MTDKIMIFRETTAGSVVSDLFTLFTVAAVIGMGVWLDSSAMQWVGFIMVFVILFSRSTSKKSTYTPQEAADFIRDEYGVTAEVEK